MDQTAKIYRYCWKDDLKINKRAKFESDIVWGTSQDTAPQICEILQPFFIPPSPQHTNVCKILRLSWEPYLDPGKFAEFKAHFSAGC